MPVEHGQIRYRAVATLDSRHPSYASTDPEAPLVISMDSQTNGTVTVARGEYPYNRCYSITGVAPHVIIIGGDIRRGNSSTIFVNSPRIGSVSAFSDVSVSAAPSTKLILRTGAQVLPKSK